MLLRKHAQGRHIRACTADPFGRRLHLLLGAGEDARPDGICLDLRLGPSLERFDLLPPPEEPVWPKAGELAAALENWRAWPALTPALRRTLRLLDEPESLALLADLEAGGGDLFLYGEGENMELYAWPLPPELRAGRDERVFEDVFEATTLYGESRALAELDAAVLKKADLPRRRELRRLQRLLEKLDAEEERLRGLDAWRTEAEAVKALLWRHAPETRATEALAGEGFATAPDPRHSLRAHMERLFHGARRGRRGLEMLAGRREDLRRELERLEHGPAVAAQTPPAARFDGLSGGCAGKKAWPKNVRAFLSSDGLTLLRGRDAQGNLALLRLARPQDLWLHAEGGPGAHVLIRCGQAEVPERSLLEAAGLAAAKSVWSGGTGARVICARASRVHPVKGAKPGTVRVDAVERTLDVPVDLELEERLRAL